MSIVPVLRCKQGVTFDRIAPGGFRLLAALDDACQVMRQDLMITAGTNDHDTGRHPLGEAYDVSVKDLRPDEIRRLVETLRTRLGAAFGVFYETGDTVSDPILVPIALVNADASGPHIHMQVRRGKVFPPTTVGEMV